MENNDQLLSTTLLAASSGARVMTGISATTHVLAKANVVGDRAANATKVWAAGELVGDKLPNIPNRIDGPSLVGRVAAGALIGAAIGTATKRDRLMLAIAGGLTAFVSAHATFRLRRALSERIPAFAAALVEDAAVVAVASLGARMLNDATVKRATDVSSATAASPPRSRSSTSAARAGRDR